MAETLPDPDHLRAQARHHREEALKTKDPAARAQRLLVADEYEKLANAIEAEQGQPPKRTVQ
ncbi:MAG TPA: hypothetical protein VGB82_27405 [Alphaproteobacteria bacterium]